MKLSPDTAFLIISSYGRPKQLKRALTAKISGFIPKTSSAEEFADAIRTVNSGRRYVDPELAAMTISAGESPLTAREEELLRLAGQGLTVEDIAKRAHLAQGTTRNYLSSAMSKLGAHNRFEAFTRATERGWM